jgi:prepilin-type processing-associated H-X9-DG protein/prepilin-type N-terminal cleavage/methylation domain-containing protein
VSQKNRAFTLVELLVAMGIIALILSLMLPALTSVREQARRVKCLSNLRQMAIAAHVYAATYRGSYPIGYYFRTTPQFTAYEWDYITTRDFSTTPPTTIVEPGLLWEGRGTMAIQQCPSFDGKANSLDDPYTGYNYNVSYIGHGSGEAVVKPAKVSDVRNPSRCALFGDGQYAAGGNKFMRSPFTAPGDMFPSRSAGTQGFRHRGRTNVAFCDGHADTRGERYTNTYAGEQANIAPGTGFLSADNSMYESN